jgi:hypothetical protein
MPNRICSNKNWRRPALHLLVVLCMAMFLGGCSLFTAPYPGPRPIGQTQPAAPPQSPQPQTKTGPTPSAAPQPPEPAPAPSPKANPRAQASLDITEQGRQLLLGGQVDEAISVLERATGLNPDNGQAYYWLAEAWLKKGNPSQALENHHQAWLRLRGQSAWSGRLRGQRIRIQGGGG